MSGPARVVARLCGLVVLVTLGVAGATGAPGASAHSQLLSTAPAAGGELAAAPAEVALTFNEPPIALGSVVRVTGPSGQVVSAGAVRVLDDTVHQGMASAGGGTYRVDWHVTSEDGHPVSDTFTFSVAGPRQAATPSVSTPTGAAGDEQGSPRGLGGPALVALLAVVVIAVVAASLGLARHRRT